jgi:predicted TIM-barrel fold metal-dependent hydrolase
MELMDSANIIRFNIVCTPHPERLTLVPDALYIKSLHPKKVYVFGGLDISHYFMSPKRVGQKLAANAQALIEMGCDGIKLIEGKPDIRRQIPIPPFDSPQMEPFWLYLDNAKIPIIWHVNDPEEFWDSEKIPPWAKEQGWFYGDGSVINNEDQYTEVINVLDQHPNLQVIFAHFFFLSKQLPRLKAYLDKYPGMHIDITPGIELYDNLSKDPEEAKKFFTRYQDRIIYGTDIGAHALLAEHPIVDPDESWTRMNVARLFLEYQSSFKLEQEGYLFGRPSEFHGLGLEEDVLHKIYFKNFERLVGGDPAPLNAEKISKECKRLSRMIRIMGWIQRDLKTNPTTAIQMNKYFKNLHKEKIK